MVLQRTIENFDNDIMTMIMTIVTRSDRFLNIFKTVIL